MTAFWSAYEEGEAVVAAAKAEALRAEREAHFLTRIPDAAERVCCELRFAPVICEDDCQVLAGVLS